MLTHPALIQRVSPADLGRVLPHLLRVFCLSVHHSAKPFYSLEQLEAWAPSELGRLPEYACSAEGQERYRRFRARLETQILYVSASTRTAFNSAALSQIPFGQIAGFASLDAQNSKTFLGHIDYFYVHPVAQHQGIGRALMQAIFAEARYLGLSELSANVSLAAHPFFSRAGFNTLRRHSVQISGITLDNYQMRIAGF